MSGTLTSVVVWLVSAGARDGTRTLGSRLSMDCGKIKSEDEEVEVGGYDPAGRADVLLGE